MLWMSGLLAFEHEVLDMVIWVREAWCKHRHMPCKCVRCELKRL